MISGPKRRTATADSSVGFFEPCFWTSHTPVKKPEAMPMNQPRRLPSNRSELKASIAPKSRKNSEHCLRHAPLPENEGVGESPPHHEEEAKECLHEH